MAAMYTFQHTQNYLKQIAILTALHGKCRRGLAMRILSVRPSVCASVCQTRTL